MSNIKNKYLYYKKKYVSLKELIGGQITCEDLEHVGFNNEMGTCWNATILSIFLYGEKTGLRSQTKLNEAVDLNKLVRTVKKKIFSFLPDSLLNTDEVRNKTGKILVELIGVVKERYNLKVKHLAEMLPLDAPVLRKEASIQCEIDLPRKFYELFNKKHLFGGSSIDQFFLLNILSIILLGTFISITYYSIRNIFSSPLILQESKVKFNIDLIDESIGVMLGTKSHLIGFFKCNKQKLINNNHIIDFNWSDFFTTLNRLIESSIKHIIILDTYLFIIYYNTEDAKYVKISFTPEDIEVPDFDEYMMRPFLENNIITKITILNEIDDITLLVQHNLNTFYLFYSHEDMLKLLNDTRNFQCVDEMKETYLMYLITNNKETEVLSLLDKFKTEEAMINVQNKYNQTALILAIQNNNPKIIKALIEYNGINFDLSDHIQDTPLMKLVENIILSDTTKYTLIKKMLKYPQNINNINMMDNTALMIACKMNSSLCIMALLSRPDIDLNLTSILGYTALMLLIKNTNISESHKYILITKMLKLNLDINLTNIGETALILARNNNLIYIEQLLQQNGAQ